MPLIEIKHGMTQGLSTALMANFNTLEEAIEAAEGLLADAVYYLHGEGKQVGCDLYAGTGLWVEVGAVTGSHVCWISGYRREIASPPLLVTLPASSTKYIYVSWDSENEVLTGEARDTKTLPSAKGEWYAGEATTDLTQCTSVDDSEAETIQADALLTLVQSWQDILDKLQDAVGTEYMSETPPASDIDARLDALEAGGGPSQETIKWGTLEKALGDPTTIVQQIAADLLQHVADYHGEEDPGNEPLVEYIITEYDVDAANFGRALLHLGRVVTPDVFATMADCAWIVWLVTGDGSDSFDFVDWTNSDWVVTP